MMTCEVKNSQNDDKKMNYDKKKVKHMVFNGINLVCNYDSVYHNS